MKGSKWVYLSLTLLFLLVSLAFVWAQGSYDLSWRTVDGGGGTTNGGTYTLSGTAGQPDAATWASGKYTLAGGFRSGSMLCCRTYLPVVMRGGSQVQPRASVVAK